MRTLLRRAIESQHAFWTASTTGASAALFRVALGLLAIPAAFELLLNRERFFADDGALPWSVAMRDDRIGWSLLALAPHSEGLRLALAVAMLVAAVTLTLGLAARASALVACVCMVSFAARNPYCMNGGDRLFTILLGLAVLVPMSRRWSVAAVWRARRGLAPGPLPSVWSLRLVQLQVAWMYAMTGFAKLPRASWQTGTMMRDVLASPVYAEWPMALGVGPALVAASWAVLAFECAFPFAIWWRRTRWVFLAAGVAMHLGIEVFLVIPLFSAATLVSYVPFLEDARAERLVAWISRRGSAAPRPAA